MKNFQVAEFRAQFSSVLKDVEAGQVISITSGEHKEPIAVLIPFAEYSKLRKRYLGSLEGIGQVSISDNWSMSEDELME